MVMAGIAAAGAVLPVPLAQAEPGQPGGPGVGPGPAPGAPGAPAAAAAPAYAFHDLSLIHI